MPIYQYRCAECERTFERTETISEHEKTKPQCPECGSKGRVGCACSCLRGNIKEELRLPHRALYQGWPLHAKQTVVLRDRAAITSAVCHSSSL